MLAVALLAAACSGSSGEAAEPVPTTSVPASAGVAGDTTTSTTTTISTSTTSPLAPPLPLELDETGVPLNGQTHGVVTTEAGWVLPVLGAVPNGWRVWTPCAREADISEGRYIESVDVVLDPGHGGPTEPGATSPNGIIEAELNLQIAQRTADALEFAGYSVLLTRGSDVRLPIVTRGEIAQALAPKAFISIHLNAGTRAGSSTPGTEMYHQIDQPESRRLSGLLYEETVAVLADYDISWVALIDAGAMPRPNKDGEDYYGVLRRPGPVTSALAEIAYVSNRPEAELMSTPAAQAAVATALATAFDRFVTSDDPGSGFTEDPMFRGFGPSGAGRTDNCLDPQLN